MVDLYSDTGCIDVIYFTKFIVLVKFIVSVCRPHNLFHIL